MIATTSESPTAALIAIAMSRKSCPASSLTNTMGRNTASVVRVDATSAPHTSTVASRAACLRGFPSSLTCRNTFSTTTMALSTTMPEANARPASETMLSERPSPFMTMNVVTWLTGIERPTTSIDVMLFRNSSRITVARIEPTTRLSTTRPLASSMYSVSS